MNRHQKLILAAGVVMAAALIVRPPYFGIDRDSDGRTHAAIGVHWIWDPPSSAEVCARLTQGDAAAVSPSRLAAFEARVNVVRLAMKLAAAGMVIVVGMMLTRARAARA